VSDCALETKILDEAHAIVFVVDSQAERFEANVETLNLLEPRLGGRPYCVQFNKRDYPNAMPRDVLEHHFNRAGAPAFATCATTDASDVWAAFEKAAFLGARAQRFEQELHALLVTYRKP